jgi:hypothetical protein
VLLLLANNTATPSPTSTAVDKGKVRVQLPGGALIKPAKVWDGNNWVQKPVRFWNGSTWAYTFNSNAIVTPPLTRNGTRLQIGGVDKRFGGANIYWLGLDDNQGGSPGVYPTKAQINRALTGAREMGVNLVRGHTISMSAGTSMSFEPTPGTFIDANLDAADYAVYQAKLLGIYLYLPLIDNWNYYHGGKWNFVHWAYQQNPSGLTDTPGTIKDDSNERQFFGNSSDQLRIRTLFKAYISAWLNHVNPYTGLAYKDEPTIAVIETGNEIYAATPEWSQDIAAYIKSIAPNKQVADGSAATGLAVSGAAGIAASAIDIVGSHYYVASADYSQQINFGATPSQYGASTSALQQLAADAAAAVSAGKVFIAGEYPWSRDDLPAWNAAVEGNPNISGDLFWAIIANTDSGAPYNHGGGPGSDDYAMYRPYSAAYEKSYAPYVARHISALSGVRSTKQADYVPNLIQEPKIQQASDVTLFGIGGGTLSLDTTVAREGMSSLKITPAGPGAYPYWYGNTPSQWSPVTPNRTYTGLGSIQPATGAFGFHAILIWYAADGSTISTSSGSVTMLKQNNWGLVSVTAKSPTNAAFAQVQLQADTPMNTADTFNVDTYAIFAGTNYNWEPAPVVSASTTLLPSGTGSFAVGWANEGSTDYSKLASNDGGASAIYSPTPDDIVTYQMTDLPSGASTVSSVTVNLSVLKLDPVTALTHAVLIIGGKRYEGPDASPSASGTYETLSNTWTTSPATGTAWTVAEINALEVGIRKVDSYGERCSYIAAVVNYS